MVKAKVFRSLLLAMVLAAQTSVAISDDSVGYLHQPSYTTDGRLIPPADYREWVFLSSGLDMSYNEKAMASSEPVFDNVFVNPEAYRAFLKTGTWPDKTQFVLEVRGSSAKGSINHRGHFQSGAITGMEVHVKDTSRFQGGWAFFDIDGQSPAKQIPVTQACYSCHSAHGAVDTTFVQFYPTLLPIAEQHGTLSSAYLKEQAQVANTVH
ncbi:cytochrome P460 family protein [Dyella halodurans]|uniref:Cytochrome P460 family protein n=1 Tax=Dyella halodurans TaxID=1920171 RepID=A0ABV9C1Y4_9GAMM|nr:cytochrome P460 family protein [Dyella halodurans]